MTGDVAEVLLDQEALEDWGRRIGSEVHPPVFLCLRGELGAGKSVLARAVARGAGVTGTLPSPTYNLQFRYPAEGGRTVVHMDLYRLEDPEELGPLGWEELGSPGEIVLVEWPQRAGEMLPADRWEVTLTAPRPGSLLRTVDLRAVGHPSPIPLPAPSAGTSDPAPLLAFDTSTPTGCVGVGRGRDLLAQAILPHQGRHASTLLPTIRDLLEEVGVGLGELGGIVVGAGPGSFTGVRVAGATARGLVRGARLPLIPVSSLAAAAVDPLLADPSPVCIAFDARGDRLFAGAWSLEGGRLVELLEPRATRLPELLAGLERPGVPGVRLAGDGAWRHRASVEAAGFPVLDPPLGTPTPAGLIHLASAGHGAPPHPDPGEWEPDYQKDGRPVVSGP